MNTGAAVLLALPGLVVFLASCSLWKPPAGSGKAPAGVVDIDGTVVHGKHTIPGAREVLRSVEEKGVVIFYLSGRSERKRAKTLGLLQRYDFPPGAALLLRADPEEETVRYKCRQIRKIQRRYEVLFGVGDKKTDSRDYGLCAVPGFSADGDWAPVVAGIDKLIDERSL